MAKPNKKAPPGTGRTLRCRRGSSEEERSAQPCRCRRCGRPEEVRREEDGEDGCRWSQGQVVAATTAASVTASIPKVSAKKKRPKPKPKKK